jgi:hypothetical protein
VLPPILSQDYNSAYASETSYSNSNGTTSTASGNGNWSTNESGSESWSFPGMVWVWYTKQSTAPVDVELEIPMPPLQFKILPRLLDEFVVPNSVQFTWRGDTYLDYNGTIVRNPNAQGVGITAGSIDYEAGVVTLTLWGSTGTGGVNVTSLLTRFGDWGAIEAMFRTAIAPVAPEGLGIIAVTQTGEQITGTFDADGNLQGTKMLGKVDYEVGIAHVVFGEFVPDPEHSGPGDAPLVWSWIKVDPGTIRYNAVAYTYIPLDADLLGIDAVRLPADGRVPIFRSGDVALIMHAQDTAPFTPTQDTPVSVGRTRIGWVRVIDAQGDPVTEGYELDRANGTVTFQAVPEHTPVTIRHTVSDLRLITDAQISGQLTLARPLTHPYPAEESIVASCLLFGDRRARVSHLWDQVSWNSTWVDSIVGSAATATLNTIDFPITVTNEGCDTDRWVFRVVNASTHAWELISEKRGLVWSGTYAPGGADVAPINPRTRTQLEDGTWVGGVPYLVIPGLANGGGWANGNVVRINTVGAIADFWIARSVAQSDEPLDDGADGCEIYALGNIDRP